MEGCNRVSPVEMAGKRLPPREVETSKSVLSVNWKEALLLHQRLAALDTMKRQVADSCTLDQRTLYNRFRTKLRHSELTHARLMERRDVVEQLKSKTSCNFNTTVTDGSKAAVREILQRASTRGGAGRHSIRRQSAPGRSNPGETAPQRGLRAGTAGLRRVDRGIGKSGENELPGLTPVSSPVPVSQEGLLTQRPYTVTGGCMGAGRQQTRRGGRRTAGVKFVGFRAEGEQGESGGGGEWLRRPGSTLLRTGSSGSSSRQSALTLFLNLGQREETPALLDIHARLVGQARLGARVRGFIDQAQTGLEEGAARAADYYWERLLAGLTASGTGTGTRPALDTDMSGWDFVGKEINYRSITYKQLDVHYFSGPCATAELVLEKLQ